MILALLEHGGRLRQAAALYNIPLENWVDLSTGINPNGWPVPPCPASSWSRLPEDDDGLTAIAKTYYGARHILPVAGSQAAIQALPRLCTLKNETKIGVLYPGYSEHMHAWREYGYNAHPIDGANIDGQIDDLGVLVLINPNNPTGQSFSVAQLLEWHGELSARGGWLIVDEAFMDATPELSLIPYTDRTGLIVLRSLGKFFGLAGARVGFVASDPDLLSGLNTQLGPWTINGPARRVAGEALKDINWQDATRNRLSGESDRLRELLIRHGLAPTGGSALFHWVRQQNASEIHAALGQEGILTRLFSDPNSLRFGLPGREDEWARLDFALGKVSL